ncbi:MAG: glycine cleavage system protein GcvH [Planctomycetia bacterium]|nr:glycine cleavage system protein GcvH [Planctomycetia bacterium]
MRPDDLKYTETHEWIKVNKKAKTVVLGITDYAVSQLSDLVHIELPEAGDNLEAGQPFGEIESVKAVSDLFAPLSGEVLEVNEEVTENLDVLAKDPFEDGWLVKLQVGDLSELDEMMTRKEYDEFVLSEAGGGDDDDDEEDEEEEEEGGEEKAGGEEEQEEEDGAGKKKKKKAKKGDDDEEELDDDDEDDEDDDD